MPWVTQGTNRSFTRIARELGMPASSIISHAKRFRWRDRLAKATAMKNEISLAKTAETLAEVDEQHISQLVKLREKAFEKLFNMTLSEPKDVIKVFFEALKAERIARGMDAKRDQGDLIEVLAERLAQMQKPETAEFEFELDPEMTVEPLELQAESAEGPEGPESPSDDIPPKSPNDDITSKSPNDDTGPTMVRVKSSNLAAVGHQGDTLRVEFHDGSVYDYSGVPEDLFIEMLESKSAGKFLHSRIKPEFKSTRRK